MARSKTPGLKKFNIYLPVPVMDALGHLAALRNATRAELVRTALRYYAMTELLKERDMPDLEDLAEGTPQNPVKLPSISDIAEEFEKPAEEQTKFVFEVSDDEPAPTATFEELPPDERKPERSEAGTAKSAGGGATIRIGG